MLRLEEQIKYWRKLFETEQVLFKISKPEAITNTIFSCLKGNQEKGINCEINKGESHVQLLELFEQWFSDFKTIELLAQFVLTPFMKIDIEKLSSCITENFQVNGLLSETELIDFLCDL